MNNKFANKDIPNIGVAQSEPTAHLTLPSAAALMSPDLTGWLLQSSVSTAYHVSIRLGKMVNEIKLHLRAFLPYLSQKVT